MKKSQSLPTQNTIIIKKICEYFIIYGKKYNGIKLTKNKMDLIIIIYYDFLPPPRRGSHVKSENTQTIFKINNPLAHILDA